MHLVRLLGLARALSDPTRLRVLLALGGGGRNVTALIAAMGIPQSSASSHLRVLLAAGRERVYAVADGARATAGPDGPTLEFEVEAGFRLTARRRPPG